MTARTGEWTPDLADAPSDPHVSGTVAVTVSQNPETPETPAVFRGSPATSDDAPQEAADGGSDGSFGSFPATPWVTLGHRIAEWPPVAGEPADAAAVARYATEGAWCPPWALGWRRAGVAYAYLVALPVTTGAYSAAWLAQWAGGIDTGWLPTGHDGESRRSRWLAARPPSLAELAATAGVVTGPRRAAALAALAASAVAYGAAWTFQRPGRLLAAVVLAAVVLFS